MKQYHCMDCGNKIHQVSHTETTDKYWCDYCRRHWFRARRVIVEWVKEKKA